MDTYKVCCGAINSSVSSIVSNLTAILLSRLFNENSSVIEIVLSIFVMIVAVNIAKAAIFCVTRTSEERFLESEKCNKKREK
jgi:uncharacterized protein (DUF697 family)